MRLGYDLSTRSRPLCNEKRLVAYCALSLLDTIEQIVAMNSAKRTLGTAPVVEKSNAIRGLAD